MLSLGSLSIHSLASLWCFICTLLCMFTVYSRYKSNRRDNAENNSQFRGLQRQFIFPYLTVLFAESLQVPFLYALYAGYNYVPSQIGALYVAGLVSNLIFSFWSVQLLSRYGRRFLCLLCIVVGSFACSFKFFESFLMLMIGRVLDGIFAALVTLPFQQWYHHEHIVNFDFPPEWISSTFSIIAIAAGLLSIMAGLVAQMVVYISAATVLPFLLAIFSLMAGGSFIATQWTENKNIDAPLPFKHIMAKAIDVIKMNPLATVLCGITCCVESTVQIVVFVWSPVFMRADKLQHHSYSLGLIYAALVSAYLAGLLIHSSTLAKKVENTKLLLLSVIAALGATVNVCVHLPRSAVTSWQTIHFDKLFYSLIIFEIAIGLYNPSMESLQTSLFPCMDRSALMAMVRIPLTITVSIAIMLLFPSLTGEAAMMSLTVALLGCASMLSVLLHLVLAKRGVKTSSFDPDDFILPTTMQQAAQRPIQKLPSHLNNLPL